MSTSYTLAAIAVMAGITALIRLAPFLLFKKKVPSTITYLGSVLPEAIMVMLVIYCLREVDFLHESHGIKETLSLLLTLSLHKWKHNTLLSILAGTLCYMLLLQVA